MTFPRRNDAARHLRRISHATPKIQPEIIPATEVATTDVQALDAPAFSSDSAASKPELIPGDVPASPQNLPVRE